MPNWRRFDMHFARRARSLAFASAGRSSAARMAMIAMATSSSISVKASFLVAQGHRQIPSFFTVNEAERPEDVSDR